MDDDGDHDDVVGVSLGRRSAPQGEAGEEEEGHRRRGRRGKGEEEEEG
jgi:hypothetical protein